MSNYIVNKLTCAAPWEISNLFNAMTAIEDFAFGIIGDRPERFQLKKFKTNLDGAKLVFFGRLHQTVIQPANIDTFGVEKFEDVVVEKFVSLMTRPFIKFPQLHLSDFQSYSKLAMSIFTKLNEQMNNAEYRGYNHWKFEIDEHNAENAFELAMQRLVEYDTAISLLQAVAAFYTFYGNSVEQSELFTIRNYYRNSEISTILLLGNLIGGKYCKRATELVYRDQIQMASGEFYGLMDLTDENGDYPSSYVTSDREILEQSLETKFKKFMGTK